MKLSLLVFLLLCIILNYVSLRVQGAPCDLSGCPTLYYRSPSSSAKSSAPFTVTLGNLFNNQQDSNSLFKFALDAINNDTSILPNVKLEAYSLNFTTARHVVLASLEMISKNVSTLVVNADDDFVVPAQTIALTYQLPQIVVRAMDDAFAQKLDYPMMTRVFPTSSSLTKGMVALIKSFNYTGALVISTKDTHISASAITFTEQALAKGIRNVFTVSVPHYPTDQDINDAVIKAQGFISEFNIRPICVMTTVATGNLMLAALIKAGIYGENFLYMYHHDMTRALLRPGLAPALRPAVDGSMLFFPRDATGKSFPRLLAQWRLLNRTIYPGNAAQPSSQWFIYDAVWSYAHALDLALKSGKTPTTFTYQDILNNMVNVSFDGVSGPVAFDSNRDYLANNGYTIYNYVNTSAGNLSTPATYSVLTDSINQTLPYIFYNMSLIPPNPGYCRYCFYGTCNAASVCVCNPGYVGEYCSERKQAKSNTIQIIIPVVIFIVIVSAIAIYYFKWKREKLMKDLTDRQRSDIQRTEIKLLDRIGRGASGAVYKALFRGTEVAAKSILTSSTSSDVLDSFKMETAIMCALRHPNIVLFMGSCFDPAQKEMLLVMEFCSRGSLHDLLNDSKVNISYELLLHLACQSSQGMTFLHESQPPIIHRDLKSHNILLDDKFNAKISDFGLTKFKDKKEASSGSELGTVFWTAPEVLNGKVHTEKSDCYSFGIVLWEMWHRSDPYPMMDLVTVAMEVMNKSIRPIMDPNTPDEIQELIRDCWAQNPDMRPDFQTITTRLRALSMQHPMHTFGTNHQSRIEAPTGSVYIVHTEIPALFALFDTVPVSTKKAYTMHNQLVRSNLELYGGYEVRMKGNGGFFVVFNNCASAVNWCVATQVGLTHLSWPDEILERTEAGEVVERGSVIWRGLRVRMSISKGNPSTDIDAGTGRITYFGEAADKAKRVLKTATNGSIVVDMRVMDEINDGGGNSANTATGAQKGKRLALIESITSVPTSDTLDNEPLHQILPLSLAQRQYYGTNDAVTVMTVDENPLNTVLSIDEDTTGANVVVARPSWLIPYKHLITYESIGKGQVGDYFRGLWKQREVAVKVLVNQKLREDDYVSLLADIATLSRVKHPNLLTVHGVCTKRNNISIIVDYIANGTLKDLIASKGKTLTNAQCIGIAHDIAVGMEFLTTQPQASLHIHDNFKSNNILVSKDFQVKITDFGQTNIKDLARTMTSISSVAWTAPEILNGEPISPKSAIYSFGIVLWELFAKKLPYENEHPLKVVNKIMSGHRPPMPECPPAVSQLIQNCWNEQPESRPSWQVILTELSYMK